MTTAGSKILAGLEDALAFARGELNGWRLWRMGKDGKMHDVTDEWSNTRIPHRAGSAGTERRIEASTQAASPRETKTR